MATRERSAILLVMGILNLVIGTLALLCGFCQLLGHSVLAGIGSMNLPGGQGMGNQNPIKDMMAFMDRELPGYQIIEIAFAVMLLILSVALIIAGIGLIITKSWGRWLSVAVAAVFILLMPLHLVYQVAFVRPATERWMADFHRKNNLPPPPPKSGAQACGESAGSSFGTGILVIYSLVLLVMMFLPHVAASFASMPRRDEDDDASSPRPRYDEDEWRFKRRDE